MYLGLVVFGRSSSVGQVDRLGKHQTPALLRLLEGLGDGWALVGRVILLQSCPARPDSLVFDLLGSYQGELRLSRKTAPSILEHYRGSLTDGQDWHRVVTVLVLVTS